MLLNYTKKRVVKQDTLPCWIRNVYIDSRVINVPDHLLDTQQHAALSAIHERGEIGGHDAGGCQGFAGVGQQVFSTDVRGNDEHCAGVVGGAGVEDGGF